MTKPGDASTRERAKVWAEEQVRQAVQKFQRRGISQSAFLEAKPAWAFPFSVIIGMVREPGDERGFFWTICGEVPCDFIASSVAATPREAARHFALKWQLDAARQRDGGAESSAGELEAAAESVYRLVRDDLLWTDVQDGDTGSR